MDIYFTLYVIIHCYHYLFYYLNWPRFDHWKPLPVDFCVLSTCVYCCCYFEYLDGKVVCLQCRRPGFTPWVGKISWRRKWQPTPVFLPGKSHGWRSLVGYSPWDLKESDTTGRLHFHFLFLSCISRFSKLILCFSCPSLGISHFSKNPYFVSFVFKIREWCLEIKLCLLYAFFAIGVIDSRPSQQTKPKKSVYVETCTHMHHLNLRIYV